MKLTVSLLLLGISTESVIIYLILKVGSLGIKERFSLSTIWDIFCDLGKIGFFEGGRGGSGGIRF
jgi:hypothetical protein